MAAAVLVGIVAAAAEAGPRTGKVVRIERRRTVTATGVHLCVSPPGPVRDYILCFAERPLRVGTRIPLAGMSMQSGGSISNVAEVTRVEPAAEDRCGSGRMHAVYHDLQQPMTGGAGGQFLLGLTGVDFPPEPRIGFDNLRPPGLDPGEHTVGIDGTGDDKDIVISVRECPDSTVAGPDRRVQCVRYWQPHAGTWQVIGEDAIVECI